MALPISEYVLLVQDPVEDKTEVTRDPDSGALSLGAFQRRSTFITSASPFPTPNVGDEIELELVGTEETNKPAGPRIKKIVTSVSHRIEARLEKIRCIMTVHTRRG